MPFETFFESYKFFLTEYSDLSLTMGQNLFKGLATILIVWFGIKAALSSAEDGEGFAFSKFATLVPMISFNYFMVYNYPVGPKYPNEFTCHSLHPWLFSLN